jgi:hypothetical protein
MRPQIMTDRAQATLRAKETALSKRYLRVIENWIHVGLEYYQDWPVRPNCGHFFGGCHWYGSDTVAGALTFAVAASAPGYDEEAGGCSRQELRELALRGIRYLCFTHDTGPPDCVRPAKGLGRPETWGNKWGERGRGYFPESQCGLNVSNLAMAALLLGDMVDDETWAMLVAMHQDYADRFGAMQPKTGVYTNTQMEENGWTSVGLASVECLLSQSPDVQKWAATARRWMFCTATAQQDTKNQALFDEGKTVAAWTERLFTALPDYMAENHGMVHPSYTASSVNFLGNLGIVYGLHGKRAPKQAFFNRQIIYDQLKRTADRNGYLHPVQGMDWPYLPPDPGASLHAAAALLLKDADAAQLERRALAFLEQRTAGTGGRMHDKSIAETVHGIQDPLIMRETGIMRAVHTYLLHRIYGDGPKPTPEPQLKRKLKGTTVYPHSSFVVQKHAKGQTSFSWRNAIMALPLDRDGISTVAPASGSFLGSVVVKGRPDSQDLVSIDVDRQERGFAASLVMDRAQRSIRQEVLYAGLPSGVSLSVERFTAREAVTVQRAEQGFLRIVNEDFPDVPGNCSGYRDVHTPDGCERFLGGVSPNPESDVIRTYDHPGWVNVDGRLGIRFEGTGPSVYHNRHFYKTWWAVADDLILSRLDRSFRVKAGGIVTELAAMVSPGQSPRATDGLSFTLLKTRKRSSGILAEGHLALASFEPTTASFVFTASPKDLGLVPVFEGTTTVRPNSISYLRELEAGQAVLQKEVLALQVVGSVDFTAAGGRVFAHNAGKRQATVRVEGGRSTKLKPNAVARIR